KGNLLLQSAIVMLIAGSLGNFIDRILFQEEVEFVDVLLMFYEFPIFNVADSALTVGVVLMIVDFIYMRKGEKVAGIESYPDGGRSQDRPFPCRNRTGYYPQ